MGTDKATLKLTSNGQPLWARQLRILRGLRPARLLVSARSRPLWCPAGIETVLDVPPSRGPLSGLTVALRRIRTSHVLVLAVDLPQMTSAHLQKLWRLARPGMGVVPRNGERFEPLSAIYPVESLQAAEEVLAGGEVSLQGLIRGLAARKQIQFYVITKRERAAYWNANSPAQWRRRQRMMVVR